MTKNQKEYNSFLKRMENAEYILDNIDELRAKGEIQREDDYYIEAFIKLFKMLCFKGLEVEKELNREMTYDERHNGFKDGWKEN